MSQQQAAYLCDQSRTTIDVAVGQAWAFAFPSAIATLEVAANYLSAAANEMNGGAIGAELVGLAQEVAGKANELAGIMLIPWPFTYAAIGPWANAMNDIKSRIPSIVPLTAARMWSGSALQPARVAAPAFAASPAMFTMPPIAAASSGAARGPKGYRRSDERIREDICDALTRDVSIDATDIDVQVRDGIVTLEGAVDGRAVKRRVEDVAYAVLGVRDVENQLRASSAAPPVLAVAP